MDTIGSTNFVTELAARMSGETPAAPVADTPAAETTPDAVIEKPVASETKVESPLKRGPDSLDIEEPEKKEEEVKTEEDPEDKMPADAKTPEAKNAWTKSRNEIKELKAARDALAAEKEKLAKELEGKKGITDNDPLKAEVEAMRKEREEWQKEAAKYRIEQTDSYKEAVTKPINAIGKAAADIAKRCEINQDKVFDALRETDEKTQTEKINALTEDMNERDKLRLWNLADQLQQVYARQEEIESNAHEALKEAQAREAEESKNKAVTSKAEEMRAVENLRPKLAKAARLLKLEGESDEDAVSKILAEANEVPFGEHDTDTKAFSVVAASILPRLLKNNQALSKQVAKLEGELSAYSKAGGRANDGVRQPINTSNAPAGFDGVMAAIKADLANFGMGS